MRVKEERKKKEGRRKKEEEEEERKWNLQSLPLGPRKAQDDPGFGPAARCS